jgi:hypothetical protein
MKKTLVSHIRNEEYLLPFWLKHHKKYFDHGIIVDYNSTDRSVEIIKEICPDWEVIPSRNEKLDALVMDREIEDIESNHPGWKMCLSTTEFLVGNYKKLDTISDPTELLIPAFNMVEHPSQEGIHPDVNEDIFKQKVHGIHYKDEIKYSDKEISHGGRIDTHIKAQNTGYLTRRLRLLHNLDRITYPLGRHYHDYNAINQDFVLVYYRFCPFNDVTLKRMTTIQKNINPENGKQNLGYEHFMDEVETTRWVREWQANTRDLSEDINYFISLMS